MDTTKRREAFRIAAGICFAVSLIAGVVTLASAIFLSANSIVYPLPAVMGLVAPALAAAGLFTSNRGVIGAGMLILVFEHLAGLVVDLLSSSFLNIMLLAPSAITSLMDATALLILAIAFFSGSRGQTAPIASGIIWLISRLILLIIYGTALALLSNIAVTAAIVLIILAWPLPSKTQAGGSRTAQPFPAKNAAPLTAGELEQYGKLCETGMITKEEFEAIRKRYLGL